MLAMIQAYNLECGPESRMFWNKLPIGLGSFTKLRSEEDHQTEKGGDPDENFERENRTVAQGLWLPLVDETRLRLARYRQPALRGVRYNQRRTFALYVAYSSPKRASR